MAFIRPIRRVYLRYADAEIAKSTVLVESVRGIRTVKSLGLEPQRKEAWDSATAATGSWKLELLDLINWPQTLVHPLEAFMRNGVLLVGVYLAHRCRPGRRRADGLHDAERPAVAADRRPRPHDGGDRGRPHLRSSMAASVMNEKQEDARPGIGLRPRFAGAISFSKVTFTYPGAKTRALD